MYKLLVLDLDDTLLNSEGEISIGNKEAIMKVQEQGIKVVLASGRPTGAMVRFAEELKLAEYNSYLISFNGGEIIDCTNNEIVFEKCLEVDEIHKLYDFSRSHNLDIITYKGESIVTEDDSKYIDVEVKLTKMAVDRVESFKEAVDYNGVKCILLQEADYLKKMEVLTKAEFSDLSVSISKPIFLEVTAHDIDKGHTLEKVCALENISLEETIAIGNAENDLSMIQCAGLGIWVDNTDDELKPTGDHVTASCDDDGVAKAIYKFLL